MKPNNTKETNYLKLVRSGSKAKVDSKDDFPQLERHKLSDKMKWRGIEPGTAVIALLAFSTVMTATIVLISGAIISLL
tara:strand:+ start:1700 stop:1933 length:234 start_codon:yes stop_codon:yes gene_type:complete